MTTKTLILADDLTGAQDTAIQFKTYGGRIQVACSLDNLVSNWENSDIWAINTETRFLSQQDAFDTVYDVLKRLDGCDYFLYKKIDSTLRGNVGSEIAAALRATGKSIAIVAPALPLGGRTVLGGRAFVGGTPLDQTDCGRDPFNRVATSDICSLIGTQTAIHAVSVPLETIRGGQLQETVERCRRSGPSPTMLICDSETDLDLAAVGRLRREADILFVGSSGLASAMPLRPKLGGAPRPFLMLVGSLNRASQEQADLFAARYETTTVCLDADRALADETAERARVVAAITAVADLSARHVLLRCTPQPVGSASRGLSPIVIGRALADFISSVGRSVLEISPDRILFSTGGDLSSRFLALVKADGIRLLDEPEPGVPLGIVTGGMLDGYPLFTKAGGFGTADSLCKIVEWSRR